VARKQLAAFLPQSDSSSVVVVPVPRGKNAEIVHL
jgi:hypothetical protein